MHDDPACAGSSRHTAPRRPRHRTSGGCSQFLAALLVLTAVIAAGCSAGKAERSEPEGDCPVAPVSVVVSLGQWSDIVSDLAGDCAEVVTVVDGSAGDPHEFEPSPSDVAAFEGADVVVVNGLGYDTWATDAVNSLSESPVVVDAGEVAGQQSGDNPHLWYDPEVVRDTAAAVTEALQEVSGPGADSYFASRSEQWERDLRPYDVAIERIRSGAAGRTFVATESVFDPMAAALGLDDLTPDGYRNAAANESEPTPADVKGFESVLRNRSAQVLIDNTQTEGPLPQELARVARSAGVPIVAVTESVPPGVGFIEWQVSQLGDLAEALGL